MVSLKNIQLTIQIFCFVLLMAILDMYLGIVFSIDNLFVRNIQVILRGVLVMPLIFYMLKMIIHKMNSMDWILLGIAESLLFYCALSTNSFLSLDYFWIASLVFSVVAITAYSGTIYPEKPLTLNRYVYNFVVLVTVLILIFSTASNISYWILGSSTSINPNAACAISGLNLIFLSFVFSSNFKFSKSEKLILRICLILSFCSTISSLSRISLIWIFISLVLTCKENSFSKIPKKVLNAVLVSFCVFTLFVNLITLTGQSENLVDLSQQQEIQWRVKGDIGSDFQRLRYYNIVLQSLSDSELLTGAGFGVRGYKVYLGNDEDVHNAFLTTLSDCGYLGTYTILFIFCFCPFCRLIVIKNENYVQSSIFIVTIFSSATFFPAPVYGNQYFTTAIIYFLFFIKQRIIYEHKENIHN
jgi:hypothetical protein